MAPTRKLDPAVPRALLPAPRLPSLWRSPAILPAAMLIATGALVAAESADAKPRCIALAFAVFDGGLALAVLAPAVLAGGWLVPLLGLGNSRWTDRFMVGAGLGIGCLPSIVLVLGSAGWLTRPVALGLVIGLAVIGLVRAIVDLWPLIHLNRTSQADLHPVPPRPEDGPPGEGQLPRQAAATRHAALALTGFHYLWLLAVPFLAITLLAAANPPGLLWYEEAGGYDVLEYHLAVPREFCEAGHIFFMPYNVYSNFPLNSEMHSLLLMTLHGHPIEAAIPAQMANVVLGILFVAAAWWTGRVFSRPAGVVAGVLAAMTPWIAYLAGIAYVEPGMLALGMLALGAMLRACHTTGDSPGQQQPASNGVCWAIAAGLLAGFSAGYKYTAIPLILIPIAIVPLLAASPWRSRVRRATMFVLASVITFSPWMIRNVVDTRNPVFPLAYKIFGARPGTWDDTLDARWQHAHGVAGSGIRANESYFEAALQRTVGDFRTGPVLIALVLVGAMARRDRWTVILVVILLVQFAIWLTATHLFARFAVVLILPMVLLAARLVETSQTKLSFIAVGAILLVGAGVNLYALRELYYDHVRPGGTPLNAYGHTDWFVQGRVPGYECLSTVNELEGKLRVMMVGEARSFYVVPPREYAVAFNHHPLAEAARRFRRPATATRPGRRVSATGATTQPTPAHAARGDLLDANAVMHWLRERGVTHVLVNWGELQRLRGTYGIDDGLNPGLFDRLQEAGLIRMGDWSLQDNGPAYTTLYEVPNE